MTSSVTPLKQLKAQSDVCPVTGLTLRERNLLVNSFKALGKDGLNTVATSLLAWSVENIEGMRDKFVQPGAENSCFSKLLQEENFAAHSLVVMLSLDSLVGLVHKPDKLLATMADILLSHVHRNEGAVQVEYFNRFAHKFSKYIQQQRHLDADDEEVLVWDKFMTSLVKAADRVITKKSPAHLELRVVGPRSCCTLMKRTSRGTGGTAGTGDRRPPNSPTAKLWFKVQLAWQRWAFGLGGFKDKHRE
ncbi:hypothetical protein RRG08_015391 [Elysia crispata]|uniref:Globin n=1 Tax=Elysia crispata TaxID=231223 RepID=A0AAE1E441_9GAST|nr:hypothetical protein RRG08_015391 [Elysia crispata]